MTAPHPTGAKSLRRLLICSLISFGLLIVLLYAVRTPLHTYLGSVTGEEEGWEQVKGFGRLLLLRLGRPPLQLAAEVPIGNAGVNPYGVNTFLEQEVDAHKLELAMRMIRDAGFRWIRQEFPWEDIEQSGRGDFWDHKWNISAWDKYDRIVDLATRYDLHLIVRLDNPPAWSREVGDAMGTRAPPDGFEDYGNFVAEVVSRDRGKVQHYQIWNEPNIYPEWGEQPVDAQAYTRLLQVAYTRAKQADPDCIILSAGLAQTTETGPMNVSDLTFLQQMYDAGAKGYFDIMGVMAYGLWTGPGDRRTSLELTNFSRPQLVREIMVRNGDADKPLWATEVGWNALPVDSTATPIFGRVTLEQQARYAVQAYTRAQQEWPWMGVLNYWFFKRATDTENDQPFYYFRLVEPDFAPLPAYHAMKTLTSQPSSLHVGYHQESHWALQWDGAWQKVSDASAVLGQLARSTQAGDSLSFTFVGTELQLIVHSGPNGGTLRAIIDGRTDREISLHSDAETYGVPITLVRHWRSAARTVLLTNEGENGTYVDVDGLRVRNAGALW